MQRIASYKDTQVIFQVVRVGFPVLYTVGLESSSFFYAYLQTPDF